MMSRSLFFCKLFLVCLFVSEAVFAQQQQQHPILGFPPRRDQFPHTGKYKKKDTVKINPYAVDTLLHPIPLSRQLFHDKTDNEQKIADAADGKVDHIITIGKDSASTAVITGALITDVDKMQIMVENMPPNGRDGVMENQEKIRCLTVLKDMVATYNSDNHPDADYYKNLVGNMHDMIIASNENKLMDFAVAHPVVYSIDNGKKLLEGHPEVRAYLYVKVGKADPAMMIKRLNEYATDTFAGEIIAAAARLVPDIVFNYAQSTNFPLKHAVYQTRDSLVQVIVKIAAESRAPLKVLPFLGDIYHGKKTIPDVDEVAASPAHYFSSLVRLRMQNDSIGRYVYTGELAYRALRYVREMNELHEEKDDVRFKAIDSLSAVSLYYILVYGQDEIYTSSFLGTFKRMMERMRPLKGNELLDTLHDDHFRTFIRMCAGYNTLSDFLASIDDTSRTVLMTNFISGLEQGREDDLEDAVDVANAFGSIRDSALADFLQKKVKANYEMSYQTKSKKGLVVYGIMASLFEGNRLADNDTGASLTSSRLHLPLINMVRYKDLVNDSGIVYQQVFFFGDKDGQDSYDSYIGSFKNDSKWKINTENKYWTVISATGAHKVIIYANLPVQEPAGADETAQNALCKFLSDSGIHPSVMIHRGHSYHLPQTLSKLDHHVKVVILGSCGGYHNLAVVLDHAPDAHIVSSKQVGAREVNEPIIRAMNTRLLAGEDINWVNMWRELDIYFANKPDLQDKFSDYVPPYRNLGAIFIKAYRKMMVNSGNE
jgi:hypothetical protein